MKVLLPFNLTLRNAKMEPIKTTQITGIWSYLETIDWSEPWFSCLLGFHIMAFLITITTWNKQMLQAFHFVVLLLLAYCAEYINETAAKNWRYFTHQQYFDSKGMFISLVWSAPILVNCLIIVASWILTSSQLLVTNGRLKLEHKKRMQEKKEREKTE